MQAREPELTVLLYTENGELVHLPLVDRLLADPDRTETDGGFGSMHGRINHCAKCAAAH